MTRRVGLYLVGSLVLVSLAGCGRGLFQFAEREPWRAEAELACLKSGEVKETANLVRISPISGPGVCGADYPLKVAALGENSAFGFADDLRPPGAIPGGSDPRQPRWPINPPSYPQQTYSAPSYSSPSYGTAPAGQVERTPIGAPSAYPTQSSGQSRNSGEPSPLSLRAPGVAEPEDEPVVEDQDDRTPGSGAGYSRAPYASPAQQPLPRLGPQQGNVAAIGPVAVKPAATLACPIVSQLDRWIADSVQPAAQRWFGTTVVEIKQISAYSCRGMNGNPNARISEHAFGNALDIAAFMLADGRRVTVEQGWHGLPEEQGFLRDIQAGACQQFTTVLAPGSNSYHYNHIHVDLMRRASRRVICEPSAVSGEQIAARAASRRGYASRDGNITGSIALGGSSRTRRAKAAEDSDDDD